MAELYLAAVVPRVGAPPRVLTLAAVKRLLPHLGWDPEFVRMFLDEVRIAASLRHPNIVRVVDFGVGEGGHYLAMEYLHGRTLRAIQRSAAEHGPLPLGFAVGVVIEVAAGLHAAHEHRDADGQPLEVVHRDVSPSNAMVGFDGSVKLLDFGIARVSQHTRMTRAGTLKGKVGYMSPEQCRGERVDRRTDVFGLGILLYELTVGRRAFYADSDYGVIGRVVDGDYAPPASVVPDYPAPLAEIVAHALAVEPAGRYPTAASFADDLVRFARTRDLDMGAPQRTALLRHRFGAEPAPTVDRRALLRTLGAQRSSARGLRWVGLLGLGAAIGGAGFVAGGLSRTGDGPATGAVDSASPVVPTGEARLRSSVRVADEPVAVAPGVEDSAGGAAVEPASSVAEPSSGETPPAAPGPSPAQDPSAAPDTGAEQAVPVPDPPPPAARTPKRSRPRKKRRTASKPGDADELLPPSWREP